MPVISAGSVIPWFQVRSRIVALTQTTAPGRPLRLVFVDRDGIGRGAEGRLVEAAAEGDILLDEADARL